MRNVAFALVILAAASARAGTADTNELLTAPRVEKLVSIDLDAQHDSLRYAIDTIGDPSVAFELKGEVPVVAHGPYNVILGFLNPITYTWTTSEKTEDDPTQKALDQFTAAAVALAELMGGAVAPSPSAAPLKIKHAPALNTASSPVFYSPDLAPLSLWLRISDFKACTLDAQFAHSLETSEADFYVRPGAEAAAWRKMDGLRGLVDADTSTALGAAQSALDAQLVELGKSNTQAAARLDEVGRSSASAITGQGDACDALRINFDQAISRYAETARKHLSARELMLAQLKTLSELARTRLKSVHTKDGVSFFVLATVTPNASVIHRLTITIKRREVAFGAHPELGDGPTVTEKESLVGVLRTRRYSGLVMEFAPGVAWAFGAQRQYGTATVNGVSVVTGGTNEPLGPMAVAMVNLIPRPLGNANLWVTLQAGIASGKQLITVVTGGGLRFTAIDLSITGGVALMLQRAPLTLHVGDVVRDAAQLDQDMTWTPAAAPYLGIQRAF
jgi:hypothetical protein